MKIRHVYTVTREFTIPDKKLNEEVDFFKGIQDETGEYLYGASSDNEKIEVKMQISSDGKIWENITI